MLAGRFKVCVKCGIKKPIIEFYRNKKMGDGYLNHCKDCKKKYDKEYLAKSKLHIHRKRKEYRLTNIERIRNQDYLCAYGITTEDKKALLKVQENKCVICGVELTMTTGQIDHSHKTDEIRGVLCIKCNTILGMCNDDIEVLKKAIKYLERK